MWFELTTLLIPAYNDSEDEVARQSDWIKENLVSDVPLHFTAYHPDFKMRDVPATPASTLIRARSQALSRGLHYVYTGNVHDQTTQSTYCAGCGEVLIERDWYQLGKYRIQDGACMSCQRPVAGRFDDEPGTWGPKRLPIVIGR